MITVFSFVKPIVLFWSTKTRCSDQLREATWAETPAGDWGMSEATLTWDDNLFGYLEKVRSFPMLSEAEDPNRARRWRADRKPDSHLAPNLS